MTINLQVEDVVYHADGTATVWLRWLVPEPASTYFPLIPARCVHQGVSIGDWWEFSLSPSDVDIIQHQ